MISLNYFTAILLAVFLFDFDIPLKSDKINYFPIISLSILLPLIFVFLIKSIQQVGIIRTDISQRLSLFLPILAAIFIFKENISFLKYMGLVLGLCSIYLILHKKREKEDTARSNSWIYPAIVFIGFGIIDILFKQLALHSSIPYVKSLFYIFIGALFISILINLFFIILKKRIFKRSSLIYGIPLGAINFLNIYFYLKAHTVFSDNPTTVFAGMNFGVILLGTAIGYFLFNEKINTKNSIGIVLALISVLIILVSQYYNI